MIYPMESSRGLVSFYPGIPQKELHLDVKKEKVHRGLEGKILMPKLKMNSSAHVYNSVHRSPNCKGCWEM